MDHHGGPVGGQSNKTHRRSNVGTWWYCQQTEIVRLSPRAQEICATTAVEFHLDEWLSKIESADKAEFRRSVSDVSPGDAIDLHVQLAGQQLRFQGQGQHVDGQIIVEGQVREIPTLPADASPALHAVFELDPQSVSLPALRERVDELFRTRQQTGQERPTSTLIDAISELGYRGLVDETVRREVIDEVGRVTVVPVRKTQKAYVIITVETASQDTAPHIHLPDTTANGLVVLEEDGKTVETANSTANGLFRRQIEDKLLEYHSKDTAATEQPTEEHPSAGVTAYMLTIDTDEAGSYRATAVELVDERAVLIVPADQQNQNPSQDQSESSEDQLSHNQLDSFAHGPVVLVKRSVGAEWPVDSISQNITALCGYTQTEIVDGDVSFVDLIYPDDRNRVLLETNQKLEAGENQFTHDPYRIMTKDGGLRWVFDHTRVIREEGEPIGLFSYLIDITDQRHQELRLAQAEAVGEFGTWRWQADKDRLWWSEQSYQLFGWEECKDPPTRGNFIDIVHADDRDAYQTALVDAKRGGEYNVEYRITRNGTTRWIREHGIITTDINDDPVAATGVYRDITDHKRREQQLRALNDSAQQLLSAETTSKLQKIIVESAAEITNAQIIGVFRYDAEQEQLVPEQQADRTPINTLPTFSIGEGDLWRTYMNRQPVFVQDEDEYLDTADKFDQAIADAAVLPLGEYGVVLLADSRRNVITDRIAKVLTVLCRFAEDAIERTTTLESLRERTREANQRAQELAFVNNLNEKIRSLHEVIATADSKQAIRQSVCQTLVSFPNFDAAWIGKVDPDDRTLQPVVTTSVPDPFFEEISLGLDSQLPAAQAATSQSTVTASRLHQHIQDGQWRETAVMHGFRAAISIPLEHNGVFYGTVSVYSDTPTEFLDTELKEILDEAGTLIGYALNAIDRRDALQQQDTVGLVFDVKVQPDDPMVALADACNSQIVVENVTQRQQNTHLLHCKIENGTTAELTEIINEQPSIRSVSVLNDGSPFRVELVVIGDAIPTKAGAVGGSVESLTITPQQASLVFNIPRKQDIPEFASRVREQFGNANLVAKRQQPTTESAKPMRRFEDALSEQQRRVLQAAYHGGYFDENRKQTGSEIADSLNIAQPTFSKHLRAAQRNLLETVWGNRN